MGAQELETVRAGSTAVAGLAAGLQPTGSYMHDMTHGCRLAARQAYALTLKNVTIKCAGPAGSGGGACSGDSRRV